MNQGRCIFNRRGSLPLCTLSMWLIFRVHLKNLRGQSSNQLNVASVDDFVSLAWPCYQAFDDVLRSITSNVPTLSIWRSAAGALSVPVCTSTFAVESPPRTPPRFAKLLILFYSFICIDVLNVQLNRMTSRQDKTPELHGVPHDWDTTVPQTALRLARPWRSSYGLNNEE